MLSIESSFSNVPFSRQHLSRALNLTHQYTSLDRSKLYQPRPIEVPVVVDTERNSRTASLTSACPTSAPNENAKLWSVDVT
ncbi:MAG: hypothetical protein CMJ64_26760 [Planctomycetaceae bacterium]|nr:hypothetical protein [Planctomycetaceae bacterium]